MMCGYPAYAFDFDYTLADSSAGIVTCFRHVLSCNGYHGIDDDTIKHTIGLTLEEAFARMTGVSDAAVLAAYKLQYTTHANTCMTALTHFFPETLQALQQLAVQGKPVAIVSTKYRYRIMEFLQAQHASHLVTTIVGGEDVTHAKPHPEPLLLAAEAMGVSPAAMLYAGDSIVDGMAAQRARVPFAAVLHGTTQRHELEAYHPVCVVSSLLDLP